MTTALTRRRFLIGAGIVGGALVVGYAFSGNGENTARQRFQKAGPEGGVALNGWVRIDPDGRIAVALPRAEMGQGVSTSLPMLLAEELEADWRMVGFEQAPRDPLYVNREILVDGVPFVPWDDGVAAETMRWAYEKSASLLGLQATGGSTSVRDGYYAMRQAGAAAREMLRRAAAARWNVPLSSCIAENGTIRSGKKSARYGELAAEAAAIALPEPPRLKDPAQWRLLGHSPARLDIPAKVTGKARYGIDIRLPGMVFAAFRPVPVFGAEIAGLDDSAARAMPGVKKILAVPGGIAAVATTTWQAQQAVDAVEFTLSGGAEDLSSETLLETFSATAARWDGHVFREEGDIGTALAGGRKIRAEYRVPFLAHACMEPMNCTAWIHDGQLEIWAPNQSADLAAMVAGGIADIDNDKITVHTPYLGGGFGRRADMDYVEIAVTLAHAMPGTPVQVTYSREADMRHDRFRPAAVSLFEASIDEQGQPLGLRNSIAGPSVVKSFVGRLLPGPFITPDKTTAEGAFDKPYEFPALQVMHETVDTPVPCGFWRSVGHSYNAFFFESFMDEIAHAAGRDPLAFRLSLLKNFPRHRALLEKLADGWNAPKAPGTGRGIALHDSFGSIVAQMVELYRPDEQAPIRIAKITVAVDCGYALHPQTVIRQMESGVIFALSAALHGEITIADGQIEQENFPDYEMIRMADAPPIEVHILNSGARLGGIGEPGTPPLAPALANALFDLTGRRIRRMPFGDVFGYA